MASVGIRDVRRAFGAAQVIRSADGSIRDGAFVALGGPTGKPTLLRMIAGLENITEIRIGERAASVPPNA